MRREPDEIIFEALKDNPKTPKELLRFCTDRGLPFKTYYRHRKRLIKNGKIKDAKYVLIQEEEAKRSEVTEVMRRLDETEDKDLLAIISEDLIRLCDKKRTATIPNLLNFLESALLEPKFSDPIVLHNIINALHLILGYERRRHKLDKTIIQQLTANISNIRKILGKYRDKDVLGQSLLFLSLTESKEAIEIIFNLVRTLSEEEYSDVATGVEISLFGVDSTLYEKHHEIINDRLLELIASGDPILKRRGLKLHKEKQRLRR